MGLGVLGEEVLAARRFGVPRRPLGRHKLRQAVHHRIEIGLEEERDREPFPARPVDHPVHRARVDVVRPALEHVAKVDDEGTRPRGNGEPVLVLLPRPAGAAQNLQARHRVGDR